MVDQVCDPSMRDEDDEIWAGVGFGPNMYKQVSFKWPFQFIITVGFTLSFSLVVTK